MKLKVAQITKVANAKAAWGLDWTNLNEFIVATEDKQIQKVNTNSSLNVESDPKMLCELPSYPTCLKWCFTSKSINPDTFAVGTSDGNIIFVSANGRVERVTQAHEGAVTCIAWNDDGSSLASAGEDGSVKVWSQQGNLRAKIAQFDAVVPSVAWGNDSQMIYCAHGDRIVRKSISAGVKDVVYTGHQGVVLSVSYNNVYNILLSGGEDCSYIVWDNNGALRYRSTVGEMTVTSVAWSPNGETGCVGSYDSLVLVSRHGHPRSHTVLSHATTAQISNIGVGSVYGIAYSHDSAALAVSTAAGYVVTVSVIGLTAVGDTHTATTVDTTVVTVSEIGKEEERLELSTRISNLVMGHGYLLVTTTRALSIYPLHSLSTPYNIETSQTYSVSVCGSMLCVCDAVMGVRVYSYDGQHVTSFKYPGYRPEMISPAHIALSSDCLAIVCHSQPTKVLLYEPTTGRALTPITHQLPVSSVTMSAVNTDGDRLLAFVDSNKDVFLAQAFKGGVVGSVVKLASQVSSALFHPQQHTLYVLSDAKLHVYSCPIAHFIDYGIAEYTHTVQELPAALGDSKYSHALTITSVLGYRVTVSAHNDTQAVLVASPLPATLLATIAKQQWLAALRLCRSPPQQDNCLWAILAVMAVQGTQVDVAELAFAALEEVDKLEYMQNVRTLPSQHARAAELLLYSRRPQDAQRVLLQSGLVLRAIKLNIRIFQWSKALALAIQLQQFVDYVVMMRDDYLVSSGRQEFLPDFLQVRPQIHVDRQAIKARETEAEEKEIASGSPYNGLLSSTNKTNNNFNSSSNNMSDMNSGFNNNMQF